MFTDLDQQDSNPPALPPPTQDDDVVIEADGTTQGAPPANNPYLAQLNQVIVDLTSTIVMYWEGWWPVLHILIDMALPDSSSCALHLTIDLLGFKNMKSLSLDILGLNDMPESDGDAIVSDIDSEFADLVGIIAAAVGVAMQVAYFALKALVQILRRRNGSSGQPWLAILYYM